jgi:hypothetical protein
VNYYTATGSEFRNNTVVNLWSGATDGTLLGNGIDLSTLTITHNHWAGGTYGAKTSAYTGDNAVNGGDPGWTSITTGDATLASADSILVDVGATLAGVTTDKAGTARPQGSAYDIGAYEYGASPAPPATGTRRVTKGKAGILRKL